MTNRSSESLVHSCIGDESETLSENVEVISLPNATEYFYHELKTAASIRVQHRYLIRKLQILRLKADNNPDR